MMKLSADNRESAVFYFSSFVAALALGTVFVLVVLEAYVRWTTNQGFTFLGGGALGALILAAFALTIVLLLTSRNKKCCCGKCDAHHA